MIGTKTFSNSLNGSSKGFKPQYGDIYGTDGPDQLVADALWFGNAIFAGGDNDDVYGNNGGNTLYGGEGDDRLYGRGGDDWLYGESGRDTLNGGAGADVMAGGVDNDNYTVDDVKDQVIEKADEGFDLVYSYLPSYTLPANVENMYLKDTALEGLGNELDNKIYGNGESNTLMGWDGRDELYGVGGDDYIDGGDGNDLIVGMAGVDQLIGGAGADTFMFITASDSGVTPGTMDTIWGFNPMDGDKIDVQHMGPESGVANLSFVGAVNPTNGFTAPGQVGYELDPFTQEITIWVNTDGDAEAETGIQTHLAGLTPDASWFVL